MNRNWSAPDIAGVMIAAAFAVVILALGFMAARYAMHPQQFRDQVNITKVTRTIYVIAQKRNP